MAHITHRDLIDQVNECIDALDDLKHGKKVHKVVTAAFGDDAALPVYFDRFEDFIECSLTHRTHDTIVARKYDCFVKALRHFEGIVCDEEYNRLKSRTVGKALGNLRRRRTDLRKALSATLVPIEFCDEAFLLKHDVKCAIWDE